MKKVLIALVLLVGMTSLAQEKKVKSERTQMEQMTSEQRNELHLKKMTLDLDLTATQQKEISKIIAEQGTKKEDRMTERKANEDATIKQLTADEKFAKKSRMLDEQIVMKERMKKVLSTDQFKKWEDMKDQRNHRMNKKMAYHKNQKATKIHEKK